jgi:predicted ATPase/DNA-binding winged helix-turn-helix (wHTH) protein
MRLAAEGNLNETLRFEQFELHPSSRQLLDKGVPARLGGRAFDVLMALVERRERLVTKNELLEVAWPGLVVEENNLQVQISTLRKLLGANAITTVPGRGYRFTASLAADPGAHPGVQMAALVRTDERHDKGDPEAGPARHTNVPGTLPPLFGRDDDLDALQGLLAAHRLVSIAGAGGIGKTAVAQRLLQQQVGTFADGAWLVELAPVTEAAGIVSAVTAAISFPADAGSSIDALARRLRGASLLLVLDSCEHLIDAVAATALTLLAEVPGARLVTTTQEPLKLTEEQVYRLDTLRLPDEGSSPEASLETGAVALFRERARAADPRFALNDANLPAVIDVCRQLDGLPLAIELAAARVPLLGIEGLHARLDERLRILTAGRRLALRRHQTLRAAFDWSHGLLSKSEQAVFRRLGVMVGTFDLETAQCVAAADGIDGWAVLDLLGLLVDKSLVIAEPGEPPRYRLLESGRAFALERLHEAGETEATAERHVHAMLALFGPADEAQWTVPFGLRERHAADLDNLRAALDWAARASRDPGPFIALTACSATVWHLNACSQEGQRRCLAAIARLASDTPAVQAAHLLLNYALLAHPRATPVELDALARGIAASRAAGDRNALFLGLCMRIFRLAKLGRLDEAQRDAVEAEALEGDVPAALQPRLWLWRAHLHVMRGDHGAAWRDKCKVLEAAERAGDRRGSISTRTNLVDIELARGDVQAAVRHGRELLPEVRRMPRLARFASAFINTAAALRAAGDLDEALSVAREGLAPLRREGNLHLMLDHVGQLALERGCLAEAARAIGHSRAVAAATGDEREINEQRAYDTTLAGLHAAMAPDTVERLLAEGAELGIEEVLQQALGTDGP